jgi:hypothetical protein
MRLCDLAHDMTETCVKVNRRWKTVALSSQLWRSRVQFGLREACAGWI